MQLFVLSVGAGFIITTIVFSFIKDFPLQARLVQPRKHRKKRLHRIARRLYLEDTRVHSIPESLEEHARDLECFPLRAKDYRTINQHYHHLAAEDSHKQKKDHVLKDFSNYRKAHQQAIGELHE